MSLLTLLLRRPLALLALLLPLILASACDDIPSTLAVSHGPLTIGDGPQSDYIDGKGRRFTWQRKLTPVKRSPKAQSLTDAGLMAARPMSSTDVGLAQDLRAHMFTKDGHEFVGEADLDLARRVLSGETVPPVVAKPPKTEPEDPSVKKSAFEFAHDSNPLFCARFSYPHSTAAQLDGGCSAVVVGQNTIVSAAHCFYDFGSWVTNNNFTPATDDAQTTQCPNPAPYGRWGQWTVYMPQCWIDGNQECDFAVVDVGLGGIGGTHHIGDVVGTMGLIDLNVSGEALHRASYPWKSPWRWPVAYYSNGTGQATTFYNNAFRAYSNDSWASDSGSGPYRPATNEVVGVHKGEITYQCGFFGGPCNRNIYRQWNGAFPVYTYAYGMH
jgi:V8-like Glu-specific endopeptidase